MRVRDKGWQGRMWVMLYGHSLCDASEPAFA